MALSRHRPLVRRIFRAGLPALLRDGADEHRHALPPAPRAALRRVLDRRADLDLSLLRRSSFPANAAPAHACRAVARAAAVDPDPPLQSVPAPTRQYPR